MWHGLANEEHPQHQQQQQRVPEQVSPHASPQRAPEPEQKWWHVADDQIEQMIRRLKTPEETMTNGTRGKKPLPSALRRTRSVGTPFNRSVQFSKGMMEEECSPENALQEERQEVDKTAEELPQKKKGAWKVPDEKLLEWVQKTQTALALDNLVEEATAERGSSPLLGKTMLGKLGGSVSASSLGYNRHAALGQRDARKCNIIGYSRSNRHACKDLSSRPEWSKDYSNPKLFSKVGSGLDGKGNKWISEFANFSHQPIFLSDRYNSNFENVRIAVCGHPAYMAR